MNIQTLTSPKSYNNNYLNVCPSDDAGLLRYSSSPPTSRFHDKSPVKSSSSPSMIYSTNTTSSSPSSPYPQNQQQDNYNTDLQSVVSKYHANPELLKLILASKVEEDKRRTEEAKLKAKELDLYFQQQQQQELTKKDELPTNRKSLSYQKNQEQSEQHRRRSSCSSTSSNGSTINTIGAADSIHRRIAPYSIPRPIAINNTSTPRRNSSASSALLSINRLSIHGSNNNSNNNNNGIAFPLHQQQQNSMASSAPSSMSQYLYQSPSRTSSDNKTSQPVIKISRRRRSMQAITKIVETTDFPYEDGHFWKNNGNTIQKKTGCKSVYYKCANSCKGCPVNKTVIEQPDGSYLIKYRGDHVTECSRVEHIRDL